MLRTHNCGELNVKHVGQKVKLCGWVESRRDHGGVIFIDLRDREGRTQVVFNPGQGEELFQQANQLRSEYVILVEGEVKERPAGTENKKLPTGEIEVLSDKIEVLNSCERLPFEINAGDEIGEDLRLTYRYLDLRRHGMLKNLRLRHRLCKIIRDYLDVEGFIEVETPILTKSTPEGARDFLVPSRLNPGKFYALPQSPQLFKQLLMVSGFEKYFQIARCFRDEDLRADRQPEFTQLDVEMSFITEEDIYRLNEGLIHKIFKDIMGIDLKVPFLKMGYQEAMARFGSDRPDMRFGAELVDLSDELKGSGFKVFDGVLGSGGKIKGINAKKCAEFSHSRIDELTKFVADFGAPGLAWFKIVAGGLQSPVAKFISREKSDVLIKKMNGEDGDLLLLVAAKEGVVRESLGRLRLHLADKMNWLNKKEFNFLWVVDFPLFKYNDEEKRWEAEHHPFTNFKEEDLPLFETDPGKIRSRAYDMVVNGVEIGGGSIRIHKRALQEKLFKAIGIEEDEARDRFGFLLEAFKYGAPPHGGIAFGIDRLVALLSGVDSIREVIAFPKTQKGLCLMTQAPSGVNDRQLKETHIRLAEK